ncbi:MAG TPA: P-II family nitrogen regulator [Thiohalobacter sp.]|nr:P-II family nitrogen regulator [Thiohalobacter sp.]
MKYCKVTAIVRSRCLDAVEKAVIGQGARGMSVTPMRGFGEYKDFFHEDLLTHHVRVEIFTTDHRSAALVDAIMQAAYTGAAGDGLVAVLPVTGVFRIRSKKPAGEAEL